MSDTESRAVDSYVCTRCEATMDAGGALTHDCRGDELRALRARVAELEEEAERLKAFRDAFCPCALGVDLGRWSRDELYAEIIRLSAGIERLRPVVEAAQRLLDATMVSDGSVIDAREGDVLWRGPMWAARQRREALAMALDRARQEEQDSE